MRLNTGAEMPMLGFGVFQVPNNATAAAVGTALRAGYRSIDTATLYRNEDQVGAAIRDSGISRDELFVTTKVWNTDQGYDQTLRAFDVSLGRLEMEFVDLYLIHWPLPARDRYVDTWRALEKLYADGRARAIGVSNFQIAHLERLLGETGVVPAVNQVELHPYLAQGALREYQDAHSIVTEAWSPIGRGGPLLADPVVTAIAADHGKSSAQVVLRWHVQNRIVAIPRSVTPSRIAENIDIFDFELTADQMAALDGLNRDERIGPDPDTFS